MDAPLSFKGRVDLSSYLFLNYKSNFSIRIICAINNNNFNVAVDLIATVYVLFSLINIFHIKQTPSFLYSSET